MFAIPWNFPFRKKDGSISTIGDEMGSGGGSTYTLPTASTSTKGGIKIGAGLTMDGEVLNNTNPTPATPYSLPTADAETLGGVKVGTGLSIDENGVLSASGGSGGGGTLYHHSIFIEISSTRFRTMLTLPTSTALTFNDFKTLLNDKKCFGVGTNGSAFSYWYITINAENDTVSFYKYNNSTDSNTFNQYSNFVDEVF